MGQIALREWLHALVHLFFPRRCVVCETCLQQGEEVLCVRCNIDMPRTGYHLHSDNAVERLFFGKVPLQRATSYLYYHKGSRYRRLLHLLKYGGRRDIGEAMGRFVAAELCACRFFDGMDVIVPVPLHPRKLKRRGYNQSEWIARGVASVTGLPVDTAALVRRVFTDSQTRKSAYERWENMAGVFELLRAEQFAGKHVLLVDDVLTTGATVTACADAFAGVEGVRISVLTLAVAGD